MVVLYLVFGLTTALWALEVTQLFGLVGILLYPNDLPDDAKFKSLYAFIARITSVTAVLFETQVCHPLHSQHFLILDLNVCR